jgi:hypothetical protein
MTEGLGDSPQATTKMNRGLESSEARNNSKLCLYSHYELAIEYCEKLRKEEVSID